MPNSCMPPHQTGDPGLLRPIVRGPGGGQPAHPRHLDVEHPQRLERQRGLQVVERLHALVQADRGRQRAAAAGRGRAGPAARTAARSSSARTRRAPAARSGAGSTRYRCRWHRHADRGPGTRRGPRGPVRRPSRARSSASPADSPASTCRPTSVSSSSIVGSIPSDTPATTSARVPPSACGQRDAAHRRPQHPGGDVDSGLGELVAAHLRPQPRHLLGSLPLLPEHGREAGSARRCASTTRPSPARSTGRTARRSRPSRSRRRRPPARPGCGPGTVLRCELVRNACTSGSRTRCSRAAVTRTGIPSGQSTTYSPSSVFSRSRSPSRRRAPFALAVVRVASTCSDGRHHRRRVDVRRAAGRDVDALVRDLRQRRVVEVGDRDEFATGLDEPARDLDGVAAVAAQRERHHQVARADVGQDVDAAHDRAVDQRDLGQAGAEVEGEQGRVRERLAEPTMKRRRAATIRAAACAIESSARIRSSASAIEARSCSTTRCCSSVDDGACRRASYRPCGLDSSRLSAEIRPASTTGREVLAEQFAERRPHRAADLVGDLPGGSPRGREIGRDREPRRPCGTPRSSDPARDSDCLGAASALGSRAGPTRRRRGRCPGCRTCRGRTSGRGRRGRRG